jgi:ABC-type transporter Mla MlaB component
MGCSAEHAQGKTLEIEGECTLDRAVEIKSQLLEALQDGGDLILNLDKVTAVDLSFLQLLCAAHRAALRSGKCFAIHPPHSAPFIEAAEGAGFFRTMGCQDALDKECLFMEVSENG